MIVLIALALALIIGAVILDTCPTQKHQSTHTPTIPTYRGHINDFDDVNKFIQRNVIAIREIGAFQIRVPSEFIRNLESDAKETFKRTFEQIEAGTLPAPDTENFIGYFHRTGNDANGELLDQHLHTRYDHEGTPEHQMLINLGKAILEWFYGKLVNVRATPVAWHYEPGKGTIAMHEDFSHLGATWANGPGLNGEIKGQIVNVYKERTITIQFGSPATELGITPFKHGVAAKKNRFAGGVFFDITDVAKNIKKFDGK